jgi:xanthine dehydrogenase large subunit
LRDFGGPQAMLGQDRIIDHVAHHTARDPDDIRRANDDPDVAGGLSAPRPAAGASPPEDTSGSKTRAGGAIPEHRRGDTAPYGQQVADFVLNDLTTRLRDTSDYARRCSEIAAWDADQPVLERGLSLSPVKFGISFTLTRLDQAVALVHVQRDGAIAMNHGGTERGQGLFQKVARVAAARFGVGADPVRITATDTAKVPNTSATAAPSGSDLNGMAVAAACDTIRGRMAAHLAEVRQRSADDVRFDGGLVTVGHDTLSFAAAARECYMARISPSATGFYKSPEIRWDRIKGVGWPFFYFAHGAAFTEVGQIEGGHVHGAGRLTVEELVGDDAGRLRTHAPSTCKIPAFADRPRIFNVALHDAPNRPDTIYRSKAGGEPPFMLGICAFLALWDAVAACGDGVTASDLDAPATPEPGLAAVQRQRAVAL